jgi:hypothetical protein
MVNDRTWVDLRQEEVNLTQAGTPTFSIMRIEKIHGEQIVTL